MSGVCLWGKMRSTTSRGPPRSTSVLAPNDRFWHQPVQRIVLAERAELAGGEEHSSFMSLHTSTLTKYSSGSGQLPDREDYSLLSQGGGEGMASIGSKHPIENSSCCCPEKSVRSRTYSCCGVRSNSLAGKRSRAWPCQPKADWISYLRHPYLNTWMWMPRCFCVWLKKLWVP